jgi:hypothetical protein
MPGGWTGFGADASTTPAEEKLGVATFPEGYSFSGGNELSVGILANDPSTYSRQVTEDVMGQDAMMSSFWEPQVQAAMQMASMGMLGGNGREDLGGGATTPTSKLQMTEDFMKQFNEPGVQFVDPATIFQDAFERAENTEWEGRIGETGQPMSPYEIIEETHNALLTSMAFSTPETQAWAESILGNFAQEYILALGEGVTMSYPEFLRQNGVHELLG